MLKRINHWWRVSATGFSFALFGLGGCLLAVALVLLVYPMPLKRETKQRWTRNSISRACWLYVRIMRSLGILDFSFENAAQLRQSGQMVIANHPSLLDVVFLLSQMPDANCIVKSALWKNPFTGGPVRLAGYIPNNNEELIENAAASLSEGQSLIIFPEGTRTRPGEAMKFKRGFANIALLAKCPVTPVIINCSPPTLQKYEKWYHIPDKPPLFTFQVLNPQNIDSYVDYDRPKTVQVRHVAEKFKSILEGSVDAH